MREEQEEAEEAAAMQKLFGLADDERATATVAKTAGLDSVPLRTLEIFPAAGAAAGDCEVMDRRTVTGEGPWMALHRPSGQHVVLERWCAEPLL